MKDKSRQLVSLLAAALVAAIVGCGASPEPQFRLNGLQLTSNEIHPEYAAEIATVLDALFGTPDQPVAPPGSNLMQSRLNLAAGPSWTGPDDVTHGLYRRHCVHCHGISGDGRGPTAAFLDPYPRDYRKGVFKFKSTYLAEKPTDEDLVRILHNGVPGTSMPSFSLLPQPEVEALVEYVKYLAIRGEMETALVAYVSSELGEYEEEDAEGNPVKDEDGNPKIVRPPLDPSQNADQAEAILADLTTIVESWQAARAQVIVPVAEETPKEDRSPEEIAASIAAGRELFFGTKANCLKCHGPTGLGDGERNNFDVWMQEIADFAKRRTQLAETIERLKATDDPDETDEARDERLAEIERSADLLDTYDRLLAANYEARVSIPRNLRQGWYRGGRRMLDVFYRIHAGIPGTPMPGVGSTSPGATGTLSEQDIWHIVDYVMSLPYEAPSTPDQPLPEVTAEVVR
jgi:mono/diheme cytochrome c family protein